MARWTLLRDLLAASVLLHLMRLDFVLGHTRIMGLIFPNTLSPFLFPTFSHCIHTCYLWGIIFPKGN